MLKLKFIEEQLKKVTLHFASLVLSSRTSRSLCACDIDSVLHSKLSVCFTTSLTIVECISFFHWK